MPTQFPAVSLLPTMDPESPGDGCEGGKPYLMTDYIRASAWGKYFAFKRVMIFRPRHYNRPAEDLVMYPRQMPVFEKSP